MKTTETLKNDVLQKIRRAKQNRARQRRRTRFFSDKILSVVLLLAMLIPIMPRASIFREPKTAPALQQQTLAPTTTSVVRIQRPFEETQMQ